jgi:hypothetical protein
LVAAFLESGDVLFGAVEALLDFAEFDAEAFAFGFGVAELGQRLLEHRLEFAEAGFLGGFGAIAVGRTVAGLEFRGELVGAGFYGGEFV